MELPQDDCPGRATCLLNLARRDCAILIIYEGVTFI